MTSAPDSPTSYDTAPGGLTGLVLASWGFLAREGSRNGQTPGKRIVGIRVVHTSLNPMRFGQAVLREWVLKYLLFGYIGAILLCIPFLWNYLMPLCDKDNRALHDKIVSTRVVHA